MGRFVYLNFVLLDKTFCGKNTKEINAGSQYIRTSLAQKFIRTARDRKRKREIERYIWITTNRRMF